MNRDAEARFRLICCNLRLVLRVAKRLRWSGIDLEDLFQEGCVGLIRATEKFRPTLRYNFTTYATWWIRQSIHRAIQTKYYVIAVPRHMLDLDAKWKKK
jgi:RNA polymerase sigma factor (sigma-70 family)